MPDHFPFLPAESAGALPSFEGSNLWFLLSPDASDLNVKKSWGDINGQIRERLITQIFQSELCHEAIKRCKKSNELQQIDLLLIVNDAQCHCDVSFLPIKKIDSLDVVGLVQIVDTGKDTVSIEEELQTFATPLLFSINQRISQSIKSLKASVFLLNKADKPSTRCYFNELADANISKIECLVDDVALYNNLTSPNEENVLNEFSLCAVIEDLEFSRQSLLGQKNVSLSVDYGNLVSHYVVGDAHYFMLLFNKLIDLVINWNDRGAVKMSLSIHEDSNQLSQLNVSLYSHCIRLPAGLEANDLDNLLRRSNTGINHLNALPLLDLLICRQLIENLGGKASVSQAALMDMQVNLTLPINLYH